MTLSVALRSLLIDHSGVSAITTAIHVSHLPQTPSIPAVTFNVENSERQSAFGADTGVVRSSVSVISYQISAALAETLAAQTRAALQRYSGTVEGVVILGSFLEEERMEYDDSPPIYSIEGYYTIWHRE